MDETYGWQSRMERRIAALYADAVPPVVCRRDDMAKKNMDRPFNAPLRTWEQKRSTIGMEEYWNHTGNISKTGRNTFTSPDTHPR